MTRNRAVIRWRLLFLLLPTGSVLLQPAVAQPATVLPPAAKTAAAHARAVAENRAKLRSGVLKSIAWGAHDAAKFGRQELVEDLRQALASLGRKIAHEGAKTSAAGWATVCVLDSLIRLQAKMTAAELAPFLLDGFYHPMPVVLLARNPKPNEKALLRVFREEHCDTWAVAGNALASIKSKRFAAVALKDLKIHVTVKVTVPNTRPRQVEEILSVTEIMEDIMEADPRAEVSRLGYPPIPNYEFTRSRRGKKDRSDALEGGAVPVFLVRSEVPRKGIFYGAHSLDVPTFRRSRDPLLWAARLLDVKPRQLPIDSDPEVTMRWQGAADYRRRISLEKRKAQGQYRSVINRLHAVKLIGDPKSTAPLPVIRISVQDRRLDGETELPRIDQVSVTKVAMEKTEGPRKGPTPAAGPRPGRR